MAPRSSAERLTVTNRVRQLRQDRGLSQGDLAGELQVSRQTVNAIEAGRYLPSLPLALVIARLFDASVEEVFVLGGESC
jgi:putative transcriptional regulator